MKPMVRVAWLEGMPQDGLHDPSGLGCFNICLTTASLKSVEQQQKTMEMNS